MGKEITLAELAANHKQTDIKSTSENITAKEMSVSDLAKNLPGREEQEEMKAPEVVSNGLQAMRDELQKRKDFIPAGSTNFMYCRRISVTKRGILMKNRLCARH